MKKNYRKIYNRLIREIKKELKAHENCLNNNTKMSTYELARLIEDKYGITVLNWILSILPELEGKSYHNILMNQKEFKKWKIKIKI
jgi:hypothetical protein